MSLTSASIFGEIIDQRPYLLLNTDATNMEFTKGSPAHVAGFMFHCCGMAWTGWVHVLSRHAAELDIVAFTIGRHGKYEERCRVDGVSKDHLGPTLEAMIDGDTDAT